MIPTAAYLRVRGPATHSCHSMICGNTSLIAHIGYPTFTFKSPMIYNPYFEHAGIDSVVVPMGCQVADYPGFLRAV